MRRPALYSRSTPATPSQASQDASSEAPSEAGATGSNSEAPGAVPTAASRPRRRWVTPVAVVLLMGAAALGTHQFAPRPAGHSLTQKDIDSAVMRTLQTNSLPSAAARAADIIRPSVVEVTALGPDEEAAAAKADKKDKARPNDKTDKADKRGTKQRTAKAAPPKEAPAT
jgi:serine protease DegQ